MPLYEEISHIPLFVHHPAFADQAGTRRHGAHPDHRPDADPLRALRRRRSRAEVQGRSLLPLLAEDEEQHDAVIFGYWGGGINVTDGRYTWFCYPRDMKNQELYQYTVMPTHMTKLFTVEEMQSASLVPPFAWTKGVPLLRIAHASKAGQRTHSYHFPEAMEDTTTVLYDLETDPRQEHPIRDPAVEARLRAALFRIMAENDAPAEVVRRMEESVGAPA